MTAKTITPKNWLLTAYAGRYYSDNQAPVGSGEALVEWDAVVPAGSAALAGYRVYWKNSDPGETDVYTQTIGSGQLVAAPTTYLLVTGLTPAATYWFAVTAVDADGYESEYLRLGSKVIT